MARQNARDLEVFKLRRAGMSFAEIADAVGLAGKSGAHQAYTRALETWGPVIEDVSAVKLEQLDRLDAMLRAVWPDAQAGAKEAVDQVLKIQRQQAQLMGMSAAPATSAEPEEPVRDDLARLRAQREAVRKAT